MTELDPRVRRSRAAVLNAAVRLVDERGLDQISFTDIAKEAQLSRQAVYLHYTDRDAILTEAAVTRLSGVLALTSDPFPSFGQDEVPPGLVRLAEHLREHDVFYRRLFTGSPALTLVGQMYRAFAGYAEHMMQSTPHPEGRTRPPVRDLADFMSGGGVVYMISWVVRDAAEACSPREMAERLWTLVQWAVDPPAQHD
ncbi:TetR/AcrR family transcriptional regulator [Umezawaea beigongshangensis]|uniref:TetR/AcrR family transcriptional regulator n=1 Tax=Umezawaea beigongshangensis TaxID=2780383 RepID=UPI0018F17DAB|nr:TetR/AcrR family transcriptional regulator [Umezawaea beigongshangensis]